MLIINPFIITSVDILPFLTAVGPATLRQGQVSTFDLAGSGFASGMTVTVSGSNVSAGAVTVTSSTTAYVTLTATGGSAATARDITITNPNTLDSTLVEAVTVRGVVVYATCSAANGTALGSLTHEKGAVTAPDASVWAVQSNRLALTTPDSGFGTLAITPTATGIQHLSFNVLIPSGDFSLYFVGNRVDGNNWSGLLLNRVGGTSILRLQHAIAGSIISVGADASTTYTTGQVYRVEWHTVGDTMGGSISGGDLAAFVPVAATIGSRPNQNGTGVQFVTTQGGSETAVGIDTIFLSDTNQPLLMFIDPTLGSDIDDESYSAHNRNGSGGDGNARRTINGGFAASTETVRIVVRAGTYEELNGSHAFNAGTLTQFVLTRYPTDDRPVLTYDPLDPPDLGVGEWGAIIYTEAADNVTISGLEIVGTRALGNAASLDSDISVCANFSARLVVEDCVIRLSGHAGVKPVHPVPGSTTIVRRCKIYDGGFTIQDHPVYVPHSDGSTVEIYDNELHGFTGYGVHLYSSWTGATAKVWGNVIWDCFGGILFSGPTDVVNNSVTSCTYGLYAYKSGVDICLLANNIARGSTYDMFFDDIGSSVITRRKNNIITVGTNISTEPTNIDDMNVNPLWMSASPTTLAGFVLQAGSPMIDAGYDAGSSYVTILDPAYTSFPHGKAQGASRDIGAFTN